MDCGSWGPPRPGLELALPYRSEFLRPSMRSQSCKLDSQEFDTSRRGGRRPHHWGPPQCRASLALPPPKRRRPPPEPGRKVGPERKPAREHVSKARTWTHWGSRVSKRPRRPLIWAAHSHGPLDWPGWLRGLCTGQSGLRGLRHWISESAAQSAQTLKDSGR